MFAAYGGNTMSNPRTLAAIAARRERERQRASAKRMDATAAELRRAERAAAIESARRDLVEAGERLKAEMADAGNRLRAEMAEAAARLATLEQALGRSVSPAAFVAEAGDLPEEVAALVATMDRDQLDQAAHPHYRPTLRRLCERVATTTGVTVTEIKSARRCRELVFARQMFCYWAARLTMKSFPEIGRFLGGRDHTTVLHAVRAYPEKRARTGRRLRPYGGRR